MKEKTYKVFVYGSLMKGFDGYETYMQKAKFIGKAYVKGELRYSFSDYPVAIINNKNNEFITGELYEIDETTLNSLRKYEGTDSFLTCYMEKETEVKIGNDTINAKIFTVSPLKELYIRFLTFQVPDGNWKKFIDSKRKIPIPKPLLFFSGAVILAGVAWEALHYLNLDKFLM